MKFTWGLVTDIHEVGPYKIVEYHDYIKGDRSNPDYSTTNYHGYIDGKDTNESWETLDDALAGLIVRKHLGANHRQINYHFMAGVRALAEKE